MAPDLTILHDDQWLCAVDKPPQLLTHPSWISDDATSCVDLLRAQLGIAVQPVHRLDRGTSGVLVFAKDKATTTALMGAFAARTTAKEYLAIVRGFAPDDVLVDRPLKTPEEYLDRGQTEEVAPEARTHIATLARVELPQPVGPYPTTRYSLVRARPETGRTHQVRRHLNGLTHPIVGDTRYGDGKHNRFFRTQFDCHRLLLHAATLELTHPVSGEKLTLHAPLSGEFEHVVTKLFGSQFFDVAHSYRSRRTS